LFLCEVHIEVRIHFFDENVVMSSNHGDERLRENRAVVVYVVSYRRKAVFAALKGKAYTPIKTSFLAVWAIKTQKSKSVVFWFP
jgi:hypothetical protein